MIKRASQILFSFFLTVTLCCPLRAEYLVNDTFDNYATIDNMTANGWSEEGNCTLINSGGINGKYISIRYDDYSWPRISYSTGGRWPEGYIGFFAKLTNKQASFPKFLKFFGVRDGDNYANWTLHSTSYSVAKLTALYHGGGDGITNDSTHVNYWTTGSTTNGVMDYYSGTAFTWPDENWHKFVVYWKMNTDGNTDGEFKVWIDDVLQMHVSGLKNRNDLNVRGFETFALGEWTNILPTEPYDLGFDNVVVASTYAEVQEFLGGDPTDHTGPILRTGTHLLRVGDSVLRVQ